MNLIDKAWAMRGDAARRNRKIAAYYVGHEQWSTLRSIPYSGSNPVQHDPATGETTLFNHPVYLVAGKMNHFDCSEREKGT